VKLLDVEAGDLGQGLCVGRVFHPPPDDGSDSLGSDSGETQDDGHSVAPLSGGGVDDGPESAEGIQRRAVS
jgi:hypothetical protein